MVSELHEIQSFLAAYAPFDLLHQAALMRISHNLEISYYRAGTEILDYGDEIQHLYIVRSGVVEVFRRNGDLYHRLDQGDIFGHIGLLMTNQVRFPAKAKTDALIYCLPAYIFDELCRDHEHFRDFVEVDDTVRLHQAVKTSHANDLTASKVKTIINREAVMVAQSVSIQEAARTMARENVSALLILDPDKAEAEDEDDDPHMVGIITDRDLCTKVLASGLSSDTPVSEVMSTELLALDYNAYIFEAMLTMLRHKVHHLPVLRNKQPIGIIEITDIVRYESQSTLLLVNTIFLQSTVQELANISAETRDCFRRMVNEDANSQMIGSAMSVIGRSFIQRLAQLAEEKLGPPPVPYCLLTLGSMAREEQLIVTDQDNALILDEKYDPAVHGEYFKEFSAYISDGLAACGYEYCDGDIMATNPEWQKTYSQWEECFGGWIDNPEPQALLNSSIFFDLEGVCGKISLAERLKSFIVRRARKNNRFLACLARNAISRTPPLGFFKTFVMEKDGQHKNSINLKRRGTAPLADIIRVYGLAVGSRAQNSFNRLDDVINAGVLPKGRGPDLRDAMEFISMVRIRHQALMIDSGLEPDNNIDPEKMSDFERRNLKDAFQILSSAQNFIKYRYSASGL